MGCISSKFSRGDFKKETLLTRNGDFPNHIVSLTSTTYGVLNLDTKPIKELRRSPPPHLIIPKSKNKGLEEPEIINAWELMQGLDEEMLDFSPERIAPSNLEGSNQMKSPKKKKIFVGKENKQRKSDLDYSGTKQVLKPLSSLENIQNFATPNSRIRSKNPLSNLKIQSVGCDSKFSVSSRSLSPLFDPELVAFFERELSEEEEQIKKMVSPKPRKGLPRDSDSMLDSFEKKCPPGGENAVVLYTTTLRGIRKTFEDCNSVRSTIESYNIRVIERDISMDSGFREELRVLMGQKEVRVPLVFVKGRLIGGTDLVLKLEEEGKLGKLFEGIPRAVAWCEGCGGLRFVMCMDCSGSCKILDEEQKKMVRCGECNENGLIQCPICC
ncbi:uncharacterized protein At3g28850-like [Tasmannia lanceolata]|uniref:uncharacterized protein At3g28850-like n=1 Tax=Tasmannia lanceolata TaxID=3420 RepID=UPI004062AE6D